MEVKRKPFQGVMNIIRFNWHFYLCAGLALVLLFFINDLFPPPLQPTVYGLSVLALTSIIVSLLVSFYIYDVSGLYTFDWLPSKGFKKVLNINAGFDETSGIIRSKLPEAELIVCDFYNPARHTEVSIKRAREHYPPPVDSIPVNAVELPFEAATFDCSLAILSAHEIRDNNERVQFFRELNRITKRDGQIMVTEHLRDLNNFAAYTLGFFHFHSRATWLSTFASAGLQVAKEIRVTPFITTFILHNNGDPL